MILSIETSTTVCSVALHRGQNLVAYLEYRMEKSHSSLLAVLIDEILRNTGVKIPDLEGVAVSAGPGSYTGLRIGVASAKGICYAADKPLLAVSTLQAMALEVQRNCSPLLAENTLLCPMLDARRMEVYCALYNRQMQEVMAVTPKIIDEQAFAEEIKGHTLLLFGNGSVKCRTVLQNSAFSYLEGIVPSAKTTGLLAAEKLAAKEFEDLAWFEPFYLKKFQGTKPKKHKAL